MAPNPLLTTDHQVAFDEVETIHFVPAVREALAWAAAELAAIKATEEPLSFETVIGRLDEMIHWTGRVFGLVRHLNDVMNSDSTRAAYNEVLPEYTGFMAGLTTDLELWRVIKRFASSPQAAQLEALQARHLRKVVEEFVRDGADLPDAERARALALQIELAGLSTKFAENVLDSTNAYELILGDDALGGLPEGVRRRAKADAERHAAEGYRFSLQAPSYLPFMKYSDRRDLRRNFHEAFFSVALSGEHDNRPLLAAILAKRRELANLLGYADYADLKLEDRMVRSGARAWEFEAELAERTKPYFLRESAELERFAREELGLDALRPWDQNYSAEKMRLARFDFDDEALRPYFPLDSVLAGLFELVKRLFGVSVTPSQGVSVWHPEVQTYDLFEEDGTHLGSAYTDWFPRQSKRSGAWMTPLITGGPLPDGGRFVPHVGVVSANFTPPEDGAQPLLTHDEVTTVFHEFGHLLHHLMSRVEIKGRSGTAVPWDFVELPSQLLENWAWEREALDLFARHHVTGETIPEELFERLKRSRTFLEAGAQMRQLSFGTADLAMHMLYDPASADDPLEVAQGVMEPLAFRPEFAQGRRMAAFTHVFAGGYAAGYYSYKWSEVLEADAFGRFRDEGIFNPETGRDFAVTILSRGDSDDADVLFRDFMGRDPDLDALIERNLGPPPSS